MLDDLAVIIPYYNEQEILPSTSALIKKNIAPVAGQIIYVDDGSTDESHSILAGQFRHTPNVHLIHNLNEHMQEYNGGKANAVLSGMRFALEQLTGIKYLLMMDSDMAPLGNEWLYSMIGPLHDYDEVQMVIGTTHQGEDYVNLNFSGLRMIRPGVCKDLMSHKSNPGSPLYPVLNYSDPADGFCLEVVLDALVKQKNTAYFPDAFFIYSRESGAGSTSHDQIECAANKAARMLGGFRETTWPPKSKYIFFS